MSWILNIKCDPLEIQEKKDPEYAFPRDEISRIVEKLVGIWGLPEDFYEDAQWTSTEITVHFEVLDEISGFMEWLLMVCIPISVSLQRDE